jgi:hypothetical protein
MANEFDRLRAALRDVADEDSHEAAGRTPEISARLLAEFRALHVKKPGTRAAYWFGLAIAATLLVALAAPLWLVSRGVPQSMSAGRGSGPRAADAGPAAGPEVSTAFLPLPYSGVPMRDGQIVRIVVPRAALGSFGLLPVDAVGSEIPGTVLADVIVGEDGLARAVRFVRAPTARTE